MRVAFLGLGRMGAPMATRLAGAGFALSVWNRTPRPHAAPVGTRVAPTPGEAATGASVAVTMLADAAALEDVVDDVVAGLAPGGVLVDMGTIGPDAALRVAARCQDAGARFLDAPVSGSIPAARSGSLVAIVGGDARALEEVRPVLAPMTRELLHLGPTGAGATMKLALNLALAVTNQTIAEALALAQVAGIDRARAYDVLAAGALASPYVAYKREAFLDPAATPVAFSISLMRKDVGLALDAARSSALPLPIGQAVAERLDEAVAAGLRDRDITAVVETYAQVGP